MKHPVTNFKFSARSDIGLLRSSNEDASAVGGGQSDEYPGSLFVVCDGMGGPGVGDVTAQLAASTIIEAYYASENLDRGAALLKAFSAANQSVCQLAKPAYGGTTTTAALFVEGRFLVAHVGNCRAYHFQNNRMRQISKDHTWVEALIAHGYLTREYTYAHPVDDKVLRAIGYSDRLEVDLFEEVLKEDDVALLCTDGVWGFIEDPEIEQTIHEQPLENVVGHLIDLANARGGRDNITAILIWPEE